MGRLLLILFCATLFLGNVMGAKKKLKSPPTTPTPSPPPTSSTVRPLTDDEKAYLYRCDHLLDHKETTPAEFHACCQNTPKGTFVCPKWAPADHVCALKVDKPACCKCNPLEPPPPPPPTTTTTTTTTTKKPKKEEEEEADTDEEDDDEDDEEDDEEE